MFTMLWLILLIVLLVIEGLTMGLTTVWFAGGALVAFVLSLIWGEMVALQVAAFIVVSVVLLLFTRPWAMKYLNHRTIRTNADSLVGAVARVTETVDNRLEKGAAQIEGKIWTARSEEDSEVIEEGEMAVVREIRGVKLILKKKED